MFLQHLGDLIFQTKTDSDTFEPLAATENAAVKDCLDF